MRVCPRLRCTTCTLEVTARPSDETFQFEVEKRKASETILVHQDDAPCMHRPDFNQYIWIVSIECGERTCPARSSHHVNTTFFSMNFPQTGWPFRLAMNVHISSLRLPKVLLVNRVDKALQSIRAKQSFVTLRNANALLERGASDFQRSEGQTMNP